jgi:hypothetical protein
VTEGVQSLHSRLQELEADVAQIQINERISLRHLVQCISRIWCFEDFCSSLYQLSYNLLNIWAFYSFLFSNVWTLELFNCGFSILCLLFVLLRQKGGVFLFLDWDCIFKTG